MAKRTAFDLEKATTLAFAKVEALYGEGGAMAMLPFHVRNMYEIGRQLYPWIIITKHLNDSLRCAVQRCPRTEGLAKTGRRGYWCFKINPKTEETMSKNRSVKELLRGTPGVKAATSKPTAGPVNVPPVVGPSTAPFTPPRGTPNYTILAVAALNELLTRSVGTRRTVLVSPVMAQHILDHHNHMNSGVQHTSVNTYASDMTAGNWLYNGEPITFDVNGDMTSGQHRCMASVKSGCSFVTAMEFGLDPGVRSRRNSGKKDKPKDYLASDGWKHSPIISNALRWIILYNDSAGKAGSRRTIPSVHYPQIARTLKKEQLENCATWAIAVHKQCKAIPAQYLCALFYLILEADKTEGQKFIDAWVNGKPVSIAVKCQKLFNERSNDKTRNKSGDDWSKFSTLVLTWNNFYSPRRSSRKEIDSWTVNLPVPVILPDPLDEAGFAQAAE